SSSSSVICDSWVSAIDPRRKRLSAAETRDELGIDGQSLGNGTAFSAVAPSQQPALAAHRSNYSGVVLPPGPNSWPLNIPAAWLGSAILRHWSGLARSVGCLPHSGG